MRNEEIIGLSIHIRGIVQGVGFRPFVYQTAVKNHLTGWVCNSSNGVEIEIFGTQDNISSFLLELKTAPPTLSRIDEITEKNIVLIAYAHFEIIDSKSDPSEFVPISPDISICPDCLKEMFDPTDRRYHYPFINCTNCGPRFSIIKNIPYDRPLTTMADFPMCPDCRYEYEDPMDRRFHAQPTACPVCGPVLLYKDNEQVFRGNETALLQARSALQSGRILAIKGLGGYHLACDASNEKSVNELRERKKRIEKPFALMANSLDVIRKFCRVSAEEENLLISRQRPIVLLEKHPDCNLPEMLAPGQKTLGFMLPYTPLHYLVMEEKPGFPEVLVMTSGNMSEEPIAFEDTDAVNRLSPLADGFLTHNRDIHMRVDDSVMRVIDRSPVFVRRSRGFAPDPLPLPFSVRPIFAAGAELKNHFTLTRDSYAFHSHYIGDLENYETLQSYEKAVVHFENLFRIKPELLACDLHPDYLSTRYAQAISQENSLPLIQVQHHHAHLAACLVDNGWNSDEPAIGLTFDGTGYGMDGTIWGGEVLVGGYKGFERKFHLGEFRLPGGEKAVKTPARTALALLSACNFPWTSDLLPVRFFDENERKVIQSQLTHNINSPVTSSMGRLFDGISSLIGIRHQVTYEGQAAIEMEALADADETGFYQFTIDKDSLDFQPVILSILGDINNKVSVNKISSRFHNAVTQLCLDLCCMMRKEYGLSTVALSGGVWQNAYLFVRMQKTLSENGFSVLAHKRVPCNDACISLGQSIVAARMTL
jgi:hydrogenase maturation protein HypF